MSSNNITEPVINPVRLATTRGYKHHRIVPTFQMHEGKELHLPMVIMTAKEMSEVEGKCYQDTLALFNGKPPKKDEPSNWDQQLDAQRSCWVTFYSIRKPDDLDKKWFLNKQEVEDTYNWDELGILMNHYLTVVLTQPHLVNLKENDVDAFESALAKIKAAGVESDFFLNGFTTHSVNQLMKYLVNQLQILKNTNGTSGTQ